ncbi:alpha/beta fold hydrolase [Paraglaciecola hydrolytica]|uniref:AB hydrolase-1 domain-containing protein n=1 Tax=Paraglaciecola hydrolytica TaxID=1799789 RepID=A0A136A6Y1_9ALTE|nr:alpha/beta hydrolase [Paraglaciecola hydrolytica]KXI30964.1 hypothetical protein AX660_00425 [Paraglaciecola hydrolytica]
MKSPVIDDQHTLAPILALHGTASSGAQWQALAQSNADKRKVYCPNLPGYGQTPITVGVGLNQRIAPLIELVHSIAEPMHLVAHSFGGAMALRLAENLPDKFISVSIYEPTVITVLANSGQDADIEHIEAVKLLAKRVSHSSPLDAMAHFISFWMGPQQWRNMETKTQQHLAGFAKVASQDFNDALFELENPNTSVPYAGPLNLFYGSHTVSIAKRICQLLAKQYPDCQLRSLSGLGHMGPMQQPAMVNHEFMQHIDNTEEVAFCKVL